MTNFTYCIVSFRRKPGNGQAIGMDEFWGKPMIIIAEGHDPIALALADASQAMDKQWAGVLFRNSDTDRANECP